MVSKTHYSLVHKFIPTPQAWTIPDAKGSSGERLWKNWRKSRHGSWRKSETRKKSSKKQRKEGRKVHFASLMDLCHLKNAELETKHQKYKGRIVLRGDIVKDDSGSYAVFKEQGSSASQMTAAKVMDIISRLPGCAGQAADAVSAYHSGQNGRCSKIIENSQIGMSRHMDSSTHDTNGPNHGPVWKNQSFFLNGIWTVILWQDYCGKGNLRKFYCEHGWEKIWNWECLFVQPSKRTILISVCGRYQTGRQDRKRIELTVECIQHERRWSGGINIISWTMKIWVALKESVKSVMILWTNYRDHVRIAVVSARAK